METDKNAVVHVRAPASLSNLGPGFDTFGLCITGIADEVVAARTDRPGVQMTQIDGLSEGIPTGLTNTAAVGASLVLETSGLSCGIRLSVRKGIRIGSGIGGSAASAVAGAVAANEVLGRPLAEEDVLAAGLEAEKSAAGAIHGDNVLPCMFGGFVLTTPGDPLLFRRFDVPSSLYLPLLLPEFTVLTEDARAILPKNVLLVDAARTAAAAAHVVAALAAEDWRELGAAMMEDRLVEPHRARLLSFYEAVRSSATAAGAFGCALSGSGPAMFAVSDSKDAATTIAAAMHDALRKAGEDGVSLVVGADNYGVRVTPSGQS